MTSINPQVSELHRVYIEAVGMDPEDLPMTACFERWWVDAINAGITSDHIKVSVKERFAFNRKGGFQRGTCLRHLIRSDEDIAIVIEDYAAWKATHRVKVLDTAKSSVLKATGRTDAVPETAAKHVGDVELVAALRKAAQ